MREFRALHGEFTTARAFVAGVSLDAPERASEWARRLELPYPLLSDSERRAGEAFGIIRRLGLAAWKVEFFRRATVLADRSGIIRGVWEDVKVRGHAREVLTAVRALDALEAGAEPGPA